jgi:CheY-like chemotaxis protein
VSKNKLRILVVDDHVAFRHVVRTMLETAAWECIECGDGRDAVGLFAQTQPDLVLMDIAMEHLDGLRATAQIKARFPAARIIILTQYDETDLRSAADEAGACGYLLKENLLGLDTLIQAKNEATPAVHDSGSSAP